MCASGTFGYHARMRCLALGAVLLVAATGCKSAESKGAPPSASGPTIPTTRRVIDVPGAGSGSGPGEVAQTAGADDYDTKPDSSFHLAVAAVNGKPGAETIAKVVVTPGSGYHVNKDYPTKLVLQPPAGVTIAKAELVTADAAKLTDNELVFDVKLTAAQPGTYTVDGRFKFAVCTESTCDPKKKKITLQLAVQ